MNTHYEKYSSGLAEALRTLDRAKVDELFERMNRARLEGKQIFLLGNGGSAAAATHWACDFVKGASVEGEKRIRMFALSDNTGIMTAYGNDVAYAAVFTEQLKNLLNPGDLVISMSVSGSSANLVSAHDYAKSVGATCVSIIGDYNGKLQDNSDLTLIVASKNYGIVEDVHLILGHMMSQHLKQMLEANKSNESAKEGGLGRSI